MGAPVTAEELFTLTKTRELTLEPGDALVLNCGRESWEAANHGVWGAKDPDGSGDRPGLDASCLEFFHNMDCSTIIWDMMDVRPNEYGVFHSVHSALFNQGVALVDNALLGPVAEECRANGRNDFLTVVAPLRLEGGTGCPVNPLAIF
jgi:kynurenine formamidase